MSRYKRYERYKDSGVEWIGEIPEHWGIIKLKFLSTIFKGKNPQELTDEWREEFLPYLSMEYLRNSGDTLTLYAYPEKNLVTVNNSDILILWDGSNAGEIVEGKNGILSSTMAKIVPNNIVTRYLYWFLKGIEKFFKDNTVGMGIPHVNGETLKNHLVLLPNLQDQNSIANFLDQKTAEIDALIADKEKLIQLLQEKRQAIITEAVTKGLNPSVKMKDSGIEWIGEIPEHWGVSKIKFTTYVKGRIGWQGLRADEFIDEGPYLVTGTDFVDGLVNWDSCYHISMERYNEAPPIQLRENDLLITKDGTIGKVAIVKNKPKYAILNSGIFVTRPKNSAYLTEFMYWILNSQVFNKFIQYMSLGSTIVHLYQQTFENFSFPITNLNEQKTIAHFLDRKVAEIDGLISDIKLQIQKLKEYRQSLISEAVTGKIDVREFGSISEVI